MSKKNLEKLSPEYQEILLDAIREVTDYERELSQQSDIDYLQAMKDEGIHVIEEIDKDLWRQAVQPVYEQYEDQIGANLLQRIQNMIDE